MKAEYIYRLVSESAGFGKDKCGIEDDARIFRVKKCNRLRCKRPRIRQKFAPKETFGNFVNA